VRFSPGMRLLALTVFAVLGISGAAWLAIGWGDAAAQPPSPGSWRPFWLQLHGAAAMATLLVLGALVPLHVLPSWRSRRNRPSGLTISTVMAVLTVSAYGLYYSGDDHWRALLSGVHSWLGLAAPLLIAGHVWLGRRSRR
jgi:hypothetical protein